MTSAATRDPQLEATVAGHKAPLGNTARAVSLLDFRYVNDRSAHYDLIGELLRDYPPFQDYTKPRK